MATATDYSTIVIPSNAKDRLVIAECLQQIVDSKTIESGAKAVQKDIKSRLKKEYNFPTDTVNTWVTDLMDPEKRQASEAKAELINEGRIAFIDGNRANKDAVIKQQAATMTNGDFMTPGERAESSEDDANALFGDALNELAEDKAALEQTAKEEAEAKALADKAAKAEKAKLAKEKKAEDKAAKEAAAKIIEQEKIDAARIAEQQAEDDLIAKSDAENAANTDSDFSDLDDLDFDNLKEEPIKQVENVVEDSAPDLIDIDDIFNLDDTPTPPAPKTETQVNLESEIAAEDEIFMGFGESAADLGNSPTNEDLAVVNANADIQTALNEEQPKRVPKSDAEMAEQMLNDAFPVDDKPAEKPFDPDAQRPGESDDDYVERMFEDF